MKKILTAGLFLLAGSAHSAAYDCVAKSLYVDKGEVIENVSVFDNTNVIVIMTPDTMILSESNVKRIKSKEGVTDARHWSRSDGASFVTLFSNKLGRIFVMFDQTGSKVMTAVNCELKHRELAK